MNTDISERKRQEELLRRNHETFFNLVQNAPFGIYIVDADFRLIQISAGARKVFSGIDPLIEHDFAEILRIVWEEPFATEAIEHFRRTLETGETYHAFDSTEQRGNVRDVESYDWKIERVTLPDGTFGAVCYFYDLTAQKQIEQALRESEERMRLAMNASAILTWEIDVASNQTKVSDNFAQVFNFSEQLRPTNRHLPPESPEPRAAEAIFVLNAASSTRKRRRSSGSKRTRPSSKRRRIKVYASSASSRTSTTANAPKKICANPKKNFAPSPTTFRSSPG
jgi:PAS domain-containing protein